MFMQIGVLRESRKLEFVSDMSRLTHEGHMRYDGGTPVVILTPSQRATIYDYVQSCGPLVTINTIRDFAAKLVGT